MSLSEHEFGGVATDLKLKVVEGYLKAFTTALRPHFKQLWYIDGFAGTGERTERHDAHDGTLFVPASPERVERHRGSAKIAIEISPAFDKLVFIEKDASHCAALEQLKQSYQDRSIEILNGIADEQIKALIAGRKWDSTRAVMFLDPYGMSVSWSTLETISSTRAIDVWYLVSLSGIFRQAARNWSAIDAGKRAAITNMLGSNAWEKEWYERRESSDLFGDVDEHYARTADVDKIESFVNRRLKDIFPKVLEPLRLYNQQGVPMFALFFAISNPDPKAIGLAEKIARQRLMVGRSSHRRPR